MDNNAAKDRPIISIRDMDKYFGELHVLKSIRLDVREGEVVVIIGASGSGKSTLLRCINMLELPQRGFVAFRGKPILKNRNLTALRKEIGMVFQHFNLFPHMTVLKNVMEGPVHTGKMRVH